MDYKDTLNLAQSEFPMRGNLPQNEPNVYKKWRNQDMFARFANNGTESFILHDGPPYANGHLHIGHALNKILKDIIVKYHYFCGKNVFYTPGWDCHGLPIEQQIEKEMGGKKASKAEFRTLCRAHASKFIKIQSDEFQHFGVLGDFKNPYITMDYAFEARIFENLCEIAKCGILAQRNKPIYWSWACQTALAEAEVEYKDKQSHSIFVAFALKDSALKALGAQKASIVIWTTTPWTLPANVAIAINPNETYVLTKSGLIVAKALYERLCDDLNLGEIISEHNANALENLFATNPLNGRDSRIICGEHVSTEDGSGAVHTAPGHGEEDYRIGLKYDLEMIMPVDSYGRFDDTVARLGLVPRENMDNIIGKNVFSAQDEILRILGPALLKHTTITHSYPHCWRSHKPVIYRATTQWFILMDKPFFEGKTLRQIALEEIEKINFYPKSGYKRLKSMIENRPDWCISRQRAWGVPIAFFHYKDSKEAIFDDDIFAYLAQKFASEGLDCWWECDVVDLLPQSWKAHAHKLYKGEHILDVWFDSGSTWSAVLDSPKYRAGSYPADMYLEGSDQHRGWFQSSLLISCALRHKAPFKSILTHGFTIDENGEKMSKSKGNVVLPESVLKDYGSEILRLWVALSDYQSDLKISPNILKQISEQYRKIRNSLRFLLANTNDFNSFVDKKDLGNIDKWILKECDDVFMRANELFSEYEFSKAFGVVMNFISNELSGIYLDLCKDSLYCDAADSIKRRAIQSTLCVIARKLCTFLAPTLTYTTDEVLRYANDAIKGDWSDVFSVREAMNPYKKLGICKIGALDADEALEIRALLGVEMDKLKKDKIIKSSLELDLVIDGIDEKDGEVLAMFFIVSRVTSKQSSEISSISLKNGKVVQICKAKYHKCPRCWRFLAESNESLCDRCNECV